MIALFKEVLLPYLVWSIVMGTFFYGLFKKPQAALLLMAFLVSLPSIWYPAQSLPLGQKTMDMLVISSLLGLSIQKIGFERAPKHKLLIWIFVITYIATWNTSLRYGLSMPLTLDNPVLADWKNYVLMMCLYFAAFNVMKTEEDVKKLIVVMMGALLLIIVQNYRSVMSGEQYSQTTRAAGPFEVVGLNCNHFGAFLAHYCTAALGLFLMDKESKLRRIMYFMIFAGGVYPIFYTYSRGAYLATFVALFVIGVVRFRPILLLVFILAMTWQTLLPESVVARIQMTENSSGQLEESAALRLVVWDLAKNLFSDNPIFGIGFNGFIFASHGMRLHNTHNFYLQTAAEQGIVGIVILSALVLRGGWSAWKLFRSDASGFARGTGLAFLSATIAVMVTNIFGDRFSQLALGGYFFLFMGAVDRLTLLNDQRRPAPSKPVRAVRLPRAPRSTAIGDAR
jgi:hypothetical protein